MKNPRAIGAGPAGTGAMELLGSGSEIPDPAVLRQQFLALPGAPRLVGMVAAAATAGDEASVDAALDDFDESPDLRLGLLHCVNHRLRELGEYEGDLKPWARWQHRMRADEWHEAGAGFRARLDADLNRRRDWELRMARRDRERAERDLPHEVLPLLRRGAPKARIEEVAGRYAEPRGPLPWPAVFRVLNDCFDQVHAAGGRR